MEELITIQCQDCGNKSRIKPGVPTRWECVTCGSNEMVLSCPGYKSITAVCQHCKGDMNVNMREKFTAIHDVPTCKSKTFTVVKGEREQKEIVEDLSIKKPETPLRKEPLPKASKRSFSRKKKGK